MDTMKPLVSPSETHQAIGGPLTHAFGSYGASCFRIRFTCKIYNKKKTSLNNHVRWGVVFLMKSLLWLNEDIQNNI